MCRAHLSRAAQLPLDWTFVHLHGQEALSCHAVVLLICLECLRLVMPPLNLHMTCPQLQAWQE